MSPGSSPYARNHSYAQIHSSPRLGSELNIHDPEDGIDGVSASWRHGYKHLAGIHVPQDVKPTLGKYSLPSFRSLFGSDDDQPPLTSDFDKADFSDEIDVNSRDHSGDIAGHTSDSPSVTDDELDLDQDEGLSFVEYDARATHFSTSAERGRWMDGPSPVKMSAFLRPRHSEPMASPPPMLANLAASRRISEPALSSEAVASLLAPSSEPPASITDDSPSSDAADVPQSSPPPSTPSLISEDLYPTSDRMENSPLPPSSPPLSPMSLTASPIIGPASPFLLASPVCDDAFPLLSPMSSPLSELSEMDDMDVETMNLTEEELEKPSSSQVDEASSSSVSPGWSISDHTILIIILFILSRPCVF